MFCSAKWQIFLYIKCEIMRRGDNSLLHHLLNVSCISFLGCANHPKLLMAGCDFLGNLYFQPFAIALWIGWWCSCLLPKVNHQNLLQHILRHFTTYHILRPSTMYHTLRPSTTHHILTCSTIYHTLRPSTTFHTLRPFITYHILRPKTHHILRPSTTYHILRHWHPWCSVILCLCWSSRTLE